VVTHLDQACLMRLLQTKEEFNNAMQSLTSKYSQDIEEVKEGMSALQVCCCVFCLFRADNLISRVSFYCSNNGESCILLRKALLKIVG